ncbi:MAG: glycosyltransferase family 2 protein [Phycisphaerae bacterium]
MLRPELLVSFVLATHNRHDEVKRTLAAVVHCGPPRDLFEIVVVDNASTDGTRNLATALADQVIPLDTNEGSCAKAYGVDVARGQYVVFLDDDSHPLAGSIAKMIQHFRADRRLAAAGFDVILPDGQHEGAALPGVFVGCGVGLRLEALRDVGGLDKRFFMQAEEYDLAFRLVAAGWKIGVFPDLSVRHEKSPQARKPERTTCLDVRNNLRVAARYLPDDYLRIYRDDTLQRYRWLAVARGHVKEYEQGVSEASALESSERKEYAGFRLDAAALEFFFRWGAMESAMSQLAEEGISRVVFADLGKNVYAFHRGCGQAGIDVVAVADDRFTALDRCYRGVPVHSVKEVLDRYGRGTDPTAADAVIVANMSTTAAERTARFMAQATTLPVYFWRACGDDYELARYAEPVPQTRQD